MIKIFISNLEALADAHYRRICNDGRNGAKGLITILKERIQNETDVDKIGFLLTLLRDISSRPSLIDGKPSFLEDKIKYYEITFRTVLTKKFKHEILNDILFYGNYEKWGAYELAKALKVDTCPYCNRQFTFTLETDNGKTRPQFDHFFDKAMHPYLSLSFYNLVPCCSICNLIKGGKAFSLKENLHPYLEGGSDVLTFTIRPSDISFINGIPSSYIIKYKMRNLKDNAAKIRRIANNLSVFKVHQLVNMHKDYIDEIIIKSRMYHQDYIESIFNQFSGTLFSDINDVKRLVVSNYVLEEDYGKRVLSKMIADISRELKLI